MQAVFLHLNAREMSHISSFVMVRRSSDVQQNTEYYLICCRYMAPGRQKMCPSCDFSYAQWRILFGCVISVMLLPNK